MISFWRIFSLEWTALVRSKTLAMLALAAVAWMLACPHLLRGDGTLAGAREMALHYSLGGVAALTAVALLLSAAGSLARERAAHRLALTLVRPVRRFAVAFAKILAHVAVGACVLVLAAGIEAVRQPAHPCRHVLRPVLPSPEAEARAMYESYMADPATSPDVKKAKKPVVLRLLTQRARDHYQTVNTNACASWKFPLARFRADLPDAYTLPGAVARFRFSNTFNMREEVAGALRLGRAEATFAEMTQARLEVPLATVTDAASDPSLLVFTNTGVNPVMLRPRQDVELLLPADAFGANLVRAVIELTGLVALLVAFGTFLSAALSRPVALFVAIVTLVLAEMSPSVVEQYPDELETNRIDAIGLHLTRFAATATHPFAALRPLEALSEDECLETRDVVRHAAVNLVLFPVFFSLLAAFILPRKSEE